MTIAVVGDLLLDVDLDAEAEKLSPDAPVPVLSVSRSLARAGGAGLVATLLARDGADVDLVGVLGDDDRAARLTAALEEASGGGVRLRCGRSAAPTPVKTRVRGAGHLVTRLDEDCGPAPEPEVTDDMIAAIREADVVVVADYGRGVASHPGIRSVLEHVGGRRPVIWDPHPRGAPPVRSALVVTPNLAEARALSGLGAAEPDAAAAELMRRWGAASVLVTVGERGAVLCGAEHASAHHIPTRAVDGADCCGAGDRLVASIARHVEAGESVTDAAEAAASEVTRFLAAGGVASLAAPANTLPLGREDDAIAVVRSTRAAGGTVVATGGCFDLLHAGHARTLAAARALGDCLVVCLNSDDSVRRLKGEPRPFMREEDRTDLLLALACVDAVLVFEEDSPEEALRRLEPDIWVKGGDYADTELPEGAVLAEWGGRIMTVPYHEGRSTTRLAGAIARAV